MLFSDCKEELSELFTKYGSSALRCTTLLAHEASLEDEKDFFLAQKRLQDLHSEAEEKFLAMDIAAICPDHSIREEFKVQQEKDTLAKWNAMVTVNSEGGSTFNKELIARRNRWASIARWQEKEGIGQISELLRFAVEESERVADCLDAFRLGLKESTPICMKAKSDVVSHLEIISSTQFASKLLTQQHSEKIQEMHEKVIMDSGSLAPPDIGDLSSAGIHCFLTSTKALFPRRLLIRIETLRDLLKMASDSAKHGPAWVAFISTTLVLDFIYPGNGFALIPSVEVLARVCGRLGLCDVLLMEMPDDVCVLASHVVSAVHSLIHVATRKYFEVTPTIHTRYARDDAAFISHTRDGSDSRGAMWWIGIGKTESEYPGSDSRSISINSNGAVVFNGKDKGLGLKVPKSFGLVVDIFKRNMSIVTEVGEFVVAGKDCKLFSQKERMKQEAILGGDNLSVMVSLLSTNHRTVSLSINFGHERFKYQLGNISPFENQYAKKPSPFIFGQDIIPVLELEWRKRRVTADAVRSVPLFDMDTEIEESHKEKKSWMVLCLESRGKSSLCDISQDELELLSSIYSSYNELVDLEGIQYASPALTSLTLNCEYTLDYSLLSDLSNLSSFWIWEVQSEVSSMMGLFSVDLFSLLLMNRTDFSYLSYTHNITDLATYGNNLFDLSPFFKNIKMAELSLSYGNSYPSPICHSETYTEFEQFLLFGSYSIFPALSPEKLDISKSSCALTAYNSGQCPKSNPLCPSFILNEVYNPYAWNEDADGNAITPGQKQCSFIALQEGTIDEGTFACQLIHDPVLRKVIRIAMGLTDDDGVLTVAQLRSFGGSLNVNEVITNNPTVFVEGFNTVYSLRGLEYAISDIGGLLSLDVYGHSIEDIEPLKYLSTLTAVDLRNNNISDIFPLVFDSSLSDSFEYLGISGNPLDDSYTSDAIVALFPESIQPNLEVVSDIEPLKYLSTLTAVDLRNNNISDIFPLVFDSSLSDSFEYLGISGNPLDDSYTSDAIVALFPESIQPNLEVVSGSYSTSLCDDTESMSIDSHRACVQQLDGSYASECAYGYYEDLLSGLCVESPICVAPGIQRDLKKCVMPVTNSNTNVSSSSVTSDDTEGHHYPVWECREEGKYGSSCEYQVNIPCSRFRADLCEMIHGYSGYCDLSLDDMSGYTGNEDGILVLSDYSISDLTGIQYLTSVSGLNISGISVPSLDPISDMTNLTALTISYQDIRGDFCGVLNSLRSTLEELKIVSSTFYDVDSSCALSLPALKSLYTYSSNFDFSWLSSTPNLKSLSIYYIDDGEIDLGRLCDIGARSIEELIVDSCSDELVDISTSFYSCCSSLKTLVLSRNGIEDISSINQCSSLEYLDLIDNDITSISNFGTFSQLSYLDLSYNPLITDIRSLAPLHNITYLDIGSDKFYDISPLFGMYKMTSFQYRSLYICSDEDDNEFDQFLYEIFPNLTDLDGYPYCNYFYSDRENNSIYLNEVWNPNTEEVQCSSIAMSETVCTDDNECSLVCHSIHDSNLRDALCLEFELDAGCFLSIPQLRSYDKTTIDLHGLGISKLRGIEFLGCGNVTSIDLSSNDISDYSTLLFMAGLTSIELSNNPICSSSSGDVGAFFQSEYVAYHNIDDPDSVTVNADNMTCSSCRSDEEIYPDYVEANTVCYGDIVGCRYGYMMVYQDDSTALECKKDDSGICSTCDNVNMACSLSLYEQDLTTELVPTCICATNDGSACGNAGICDWAEQLCTCESDAYYDTENLY
ncbi:hypothetical protein ADUPG1_006920, partial [Aduncisulcus paluster]